MHPLHESFKEHSKEINDYLDFLFILESETKKGPPKIGDSVISPQQVYSLYSSAFVQIYNLVEGTVSKCIESVCTVITKDKKHTPADLSDALRKEWLRFRAQTHVNLAPDKRLRKLESILKDAVDKRPIASFKLEKGGGGNWCDDTIEKFLSRIGCNWTIDSQLKRQVKQPFKDDVGIMHYLMDLRNDLAHGNISFCQCGRDVALSDIKRTYFIVHEYLQVIVDAISEYIEKRHYLQPVNESSIA